MESHYCVPKFSKVGPQSPHIPRSVPVAGFALVGKMARTTSDRRLPATISMAHVRSSNTDHDGGRRAMRMRRARLARAQVIRRKLSYGMDYSVLCLSGCLLGGGDDGLRTGCLICICIQPTLAWRSAALVMESLDLVDQTRKRL